MEITREIKTYKYARRGSERPIRFTRGEKVIEHEETLTMAQVGEMYPCRICGNKVRILEALEDELLCCQEPTKKV